MWLKIIFFTAKSLVHHFLTFIHYSITRQEKRKSALCHQMIHLLVVQWCQLFVCEGFRHNKVTLHQASNKC